MLIKMNDMQFMSHNGDDILSPMLTCWGGGGGLNTMIKHCGPWGGLRPWHLRLAERRSALSLAYSKLRQIIERRGRLLSKVRKVEVGEWNMKIILKRSLSAST